MRARGSKARQGKRCPPRGEGVARAERYEKRLCGYEWLIQGMSDRRKQSQRREESTTKETNRGETRLAHHRLTAASAAPLFLVHATAEAHVLAHVPVLRDNDARESEGRQKEEKGALVLVRVLGALHHSTHCHLRRPDVGHTAPPCGRTRSLPGPVTYQ